MTLQSREEAGSHRVLWREAVTQHYCVFPEQTTPRSGQLMAPDVLLKTNKNPNRFYNMTIDFLWHH